ncbi:MAG TPA: hypothetical protein VE526_12250, partial [Solirubrobacteraceae bacterium]|nr:hypothetical protein [Solirubrobacteraceae bacterium]
MPRLRPDAGQAAAEYVALLAVAATVLAGVAVAAPAVGEGVVATIRTGLCIVGGDICRPADAAAAGLAPCLTSERYRRQDTTVDLAIVRLGGHGEWQLALQSDGGATVTRVEENEGGVAAGAGVSFSPLGVQAEIDGGLTLGYRSAEGWRFDDAAAAAGFLARAQRDAAAKAARPPSVRWHAVTAGADGMAVAALDGLGGAEIRVGAAGALGVQVEGGRRTLAFELERRDVVQLGDLPGFPGAEGQGATAVAEVTWDNGELRALAVRTAAVGRDRIDEYTAQLPLDDP